MSSSNWINLRAKFLLVVLLVLTLTAIDVVLNNWLQCTTFFIYSINTITIVNMNVKFREVLYQRILGDRKRVSRVVENLC